MQHLSFFRVGNLGFCSFAHSLFRSKSLKLKSDHEQFAHVAHDKRAIRSKKFEQNNFFRIFFTVCPLPLLSLFAQSLFFIETPWANRQVALNKRATMSNSSQRSLQKSNCERFTHVAHDNKATGAFCSFSRANRSFPHKKRANCFKNRWANSQSCIFSLSKSRVTVNFVFRFK